MSENITTIGSIEDALDNLDPSINESEDDDPGCSNCAKPRSKRKVTKKNFKSGSSHGHATEAVDLVPVCPKCGQTYEPIRSDYEQNNEQTTPNSNSPMSGKFRKSNSNTYHLLDADDQTICGYSGGEIVEESVHQHEICGDCTNGRRSK